MFFSRTLFFCVFALSNFSAFGQTNLYIKGAGKLFPIALPQLCRQAGDSLADKEFLISLEKI